MGWAWTRGKMDEVCFIRWTIALSLPTSFRGLATCREKNVHVHCSLSTLLSWVFVIYLITRWSSALSVIIFFNFGANPTVFNIESLTKSSFINRLSNLIQNQLFKINPSKRKTNVSVYRQGSVWCTHPSCQLRACGILLGAEGWLIFLPLPRVPSLIEVPVSLRTRHVRAFLFWNLLSRDYFILVDPSLPSLMRCGSSSTTLLGRPSSV